jgi:hypothetical protein
MFTEEELSVGTHEILRTISYAYMPGVSRRACQDVPPVEDSSFGLGHALLVPQDDPKVVRTLPEKLGDLAPEAVVAMGAGNSFELTDAPLEGLD